MENYYFGCFVRTYSVFICTFAVDYVEVVFTLLIRKRHAHNPIIHIDCVHISVRVSLLSDTSSIDSVSSQERRIICVYCDDPCYCCVSCLILGPNLCAQPKECRVRSGIVWNTRWKPEIVTRTDREQKRFWFRSFNRTNDHSGRFIHIPTTMRFVRIFTSWEIDSYHCRRQVLQSNIEKNKNHRIRRIWLSLLFGLALSRVFFSLSLHISIFFLFLVLE